MLKVTTSWDDGDSLDLRLSRLLTQYNLKGTFYISECYRPKRLSNQEIQEIAKVHEIGGHTLTHPDLRALAPEKKGEEIEGSKRWLENLLGSEIKMFCYPKGLYDEAVVSAVKEAGFRGARTTELGSFASSSDPFRIGTTIQIYPFPFRKLDKKRYYFGKLLEPYKQRASNLRSVGVSAFSMYSWLSTAKASFEVALRRGEVFHLWGHSWEIEKYGLWDELEKFFQYIGNNRNCSYITNSELIA